ncbi:MAG TPA: GNAT family N-acetyltransferase [Anaerolineales bacterium]|nr:GNAT family N-acetyltransferase [Anaerolineales bacterium]
MGRTMDQPDLRPIYIDLPEAPPIPGLRFRPPAGRPDYAAMVAVYAACAEADQLDETVTEADMANFMENPVGSDPARDRLVAEVDGAVIAYSWMNHRLEAAGDRAEHPGGDEVHQHRGYVHPAWRGRGIGTAMVRQTWRRAAERPLGEAAAGGPWLQSFLLESETAGHALLSSLGYSPVRYAFRMRRDLASPIPDLPIPAGLEIRPAHPEHYRTIWEAEREAFQDHWGYSPWPEEAYHRFLEFPHYDPRLWQVAWEGDQVAGLVLNYINVEENEWFGRQRGYTEDIAVRRPWRRRGVASALIARSLAALKDRGMTEAVLGVDAENRTGALRVYERLGYTPLQRWTVFRRLLPDSAEIDA